MRGGGKDFSKIKINTFETIDLRFIDQKEKFAVIIETKPRFDIDKNKAQLKAYASYEKELTGFRFVAILANTQDDRIAVWMDNTLEGEPLFKETKLRTFQEYKNLVAPARKNNREEIMRNTFNLNNLLHLHGVKEELRSQFVGTCLLALKSKMPYKGLGTDMVLAGVKQTLAQMLTPNLQKAKKLVILNDNVLHAQCIRELKPEQLEEIFEFVNTKILPFINDKSTMGQDLLNLFFTIFNKYVGKADKNQAFTPDHIVSFMCKVVGINQHTHVLDPCCGSGAFLVRALTDAMDDCVTDKDREIVKAENIYGIEYEEKAFGLATTNMLIHGDGNTNIIQGSCFDNKKFIEKAQIDVVLMNPPYNAQRNTSLPSYVATWPDKTKEDPSKGFHFVYEIAKVVKKGKLAVLLPLQCAIGTSKDVKKFKQLMLNDHHLDAVFTLPSDMFHPGASSNACCMIFDLGVRHASAPIKETFFGYFKDDGFVKRKNLGRVEKIQGSWCETEKKWLELYRTRQVVTGLSAVQQVGANDEWLAEAYMDTDYSKLTEGDFEKTIRNYIAYQISNNA